LASGKIVDSKGKNLSAQKMCKERFSTFSCAFKAFFDAPLRPTGVVMRLFTLSVEKLVSNGSSGNLSC
jgi:hypothetical protein